MKIITVHEFGDKTAIIEVNWNGTRTKTVSAEEIQLYGKQQAYLQSARWLMVTGGLSRKARRLALWEVNWFHDYAN